MLSMIALLLLSVLLGGAWGVRVVSSDSALDEHFNTIIAPSPIELGIFVEGLPKGADLHNHLTGAVYPEDFLGMVTQDDEICINVSTLTTEASPTCSPRLYDALRSDATLRARLIRAYSLYDFNGDGAPSWDVTKPSDEFFATFGQTRALDNRIKPLLLINNLRVAAAQKVSHIETIILFNSAKLDALAEALPGGEDGNFPLLEKAAYKLGIKAVVQELVGTVESWTQTVDRVLKCGTPNAEAACGVSYGFIPSIVRVIPNHNYAFANCLAGFLTVLRLPSRMLGVNIVGPEHSPVALGFYDLDMAMFQYLRTRLPGVKLSLHAGELRQGLVSPLALRSGHIWKAVSVAGASRVGHAVALAHEPNAAQLLDRMRRHNVSVEICLTSNALLLGIFGSAHPFPYYRAQGVGVSLNTDDQGLLRNDLSREFARAAADYGLSYTQLKGLARDSLRFSFLPGTAMYQAREGEYRANCNGKGCDKLLSESPLAKAQFRLEAQFRAFEEPYLDQVRSRLRHKGATLG